MGASVRKKSTTHVNKDENTQLQGSAGQKVRELKGGKLERRNLPPFFDFAQPITATIPLDALPHEPFTIFTPITTRILTTTLTFPTIMSPPPSLFTPPPLLYFTTPTFATNVTAMILKLRQEVFMEH